MGWGVGTRLWICILSGFMLTACAGPTTPFGAVSIFTRLAERFGMKSDLATIEFSPIRQILHDRTDFEASVYDPKGIPSGYVLSLQYNDMDMSHAFLRAARIQTGLDEGRRLHVKLKNLRLPPAREHRIRLVYRRTTSALPVVAEFSPPECELQDSGRRIASVPRFSPPPEIIDSINDRADTHQFNPYLLAGLIAQESGFNPLAVSRAKALGLTQITSLGEAEIIGAFPEWPRFEGVSNMSALEMKLAILRGEINEKNEWRLNPRLSVKGGMAYLNYLAGYWNRPEKSALIATAMSGSEKTLGEVMLASYNSGAARVSRAIERSGDLWLDEPELLEAKKYVRKVVSYCDHFSRSAEAGQ
jgi:hypothetical protein